MQAITPAAADKRYAKCIEVSKRIRWDIDRDVIRDRGFDLAQKFLPDGLSFAERLPFLDAAGDPIRPALLWNDARTHAECDEIERLLGRERVIAITGNRASTGLQAPKLLWLRAHEPEAAARVAKLVLPKDFIRLRLTGEYATDAADATAGLAAGGAGRTALLDRDDLLLELRLARVERCRELLA